MNNSTFITISDKTITKLAGYDYGLNLYKRNVEGKIDIKEPFVICFPEQVDFLAASFIIGFFGEIYNQIGIEGIKQNMKLESNISNISDIEKTLLIM